MKNEQLLYHPDADVRLEALSRLAGQLKEGNEPPLQPGCVNNHIHTTYSFSPYPPTAAVYRAYTAGLETCGIMDHDTMAGAEEFLQAGEMLGMPVTCGLECRVKLDGTPLEGRFVNDPDQRSIAYVTIHGIPRHNHAKADAFFAPLREIRNERNRKMCEKLNAFLGDRDLNVDFERDVLPLSQVRNGGTATERHICMALVRKITARYPTPESVIAFFERDLGIAVPHKIGRLLRARAGGFYEYDILGLLKSDLVGQFYIPADGECPTLERFVSLTHELGGVSAYAYLGDVWDSVTADRRQQKFEDDYLGLLMQTMKEYGVDAITYMPSRNTEEQLARVMDFCDEYGFLQISGEDINSPRQPFINHSSANMLYSQLRDAAYALIGHEKASDADRERGMFSETMRRKYPNIQDRILYFAKIGRGERL